MLCITVVVNFDVYTYPSGDPYLLITNVWLLCLWIWKINSFFLFLLTAKTKPCHK